MKRKYIIPLCILMVFVVIMHACVKPTPFPASEENPYLSAGNETVFDISNSAFGDDFPVLNGPGLTLLHDNGEVIFNEVFFPAPSYYYTGLGPVYNNNSCNACHGGVGEGNPPAPGAPLGSMLFRISIPGTDPHGGPNPVPGFGGQLQNLAVTGVQPEGTVNISYTDYNFQFADGSSYQLQVPSYTVAQTYTSYPGNAMLSPRVAPRLIGLGLLEAVPETEILQNVNNALAVNDTTQINGKPNYVWDYTNNKLELGRFGWKSEQPTIKQQLAAAYQEDMGVTNSVFPQESSYGQPQYNAVQSIISTPGEPSPELLDSTLYANVFYIQTLGVPARRNVYNPQVLRGQQIFQQAQCASCHLPTMTTGIDVAFPELSNVTIHPYTDLLLHDMGSGLADNRPTYKATGRQYRTAPLWGIGLVPIVDPSGQYLHDGRARTLMEAIMWHGGEAYNAKQYVKNLSASDRAALIAFLQSL